MVRNEWTNVPEPSYLCDASNRTDRPFSDVIVKPHTCIERSNVIDHHHANDNDPMGSSNKKNKKNDNGPFTRYKKYSFF
ncbi:hypothetical protein BLOT_002954 [Blomia tropicalis]|nr:hypothetical protein BLOT_002954 [Blomia tropicalis]